MVELSASPVFETHSVEETLRFRDSLFYPSSGWSLSMRRNMQEIIPGVFLGPYSSAMEQNENNLIEQGITHIVCVRHSSEAHFIYPRLNQNFTYLTLEIAEKKTENIFQHIYKVNSFIRKALASNKKVLVHGNAGISRSASFVIAFVIESFNCTYQDALKLVKEKRGCINPNPGFLSQLSEYEVIYRTNRIHHLGGHRSSMNHTRKRRHDEFDHPRRQSPNYEDQ